MNYEEKYNEILEWARKNKARLNGVPIEEVLPELAESEDERIMSRIIDGFKNFSRSASKWNNIPVEEVIAYLEKQKEQRPEWSEEDEDNIKTLIQVVRGQLGLSECRQEYIVNWLKSLRPSWKPSEEQMEALDKAIPVCMGVVGRDEIAPLESLCEELKKL